MKTLENNKKINLADYKKSLWDLDRFRKDFIEHLIDKGIFKFDNLDDIIYFSLSSISPINKRLKNTEKSIEENAGEVLDYFGLKNLLRSSISRIGNDASKKDIITNEKKIKQSYKQRFLDDILRLKNAPKIIYENLKIEAEKHLLNINSNIKYYSGLKYIKDFREKDKRPSMHIERTYLDYYFRCIDEQQKIIDFIYKDGLKNRAIARSTLFPKIIPISFIIGFNDFPYYSSDKYSNGYFNHNLISKSAHRLDEFSDSHADEMEILYEKDKNKFYRLYFKIINKDEIFREIDYHLDLLPLTEDRKGIIEELKYLYNRKRWVSFYGLALSQIEGIFSEMLNFIDSSSVSDKSLFYKVDTLRDYYYLSTYYFDYFQYHIPQLRNRYSHGILDGGEKEELNSYDLLIDIKFLLKVFIKLESPYINLTNIISKRDYQISTIEDIVMTFELINGLKAHHKKELKDEIDKFYKIQLIDSKHLEFIIYGISEELNSKISSLIVAFDTVFKNKISINKNNYNEIQLYFKDDNNVEILNNEMYVHEDNLKTIHFYSLFYKNYPKKITCIESELKELIDGVLKPEINVINKISFLYTLLRQ
ncbi:hypothetical protein GCM10022422_16480 [Flavobacterium ginsengisoli]|uniref:DUF4209 domain-containing protein n=1 Tax=Flavobacterium ginsengisoli TaxID=871694 RepID=A0ABP7FBI8_9FLAO|nr:hypothetical protein [Flavobacterium ginsengisoli]